MRTISLLIVLCAFVSHAAVTIRDISRSFESTGGDAIISTDGSGTWTGSGTAEDPWQLTNAMTAVLDDEGKLTISGSGDMPNWSGWGDGQAPWCSQRAKIVCAIINVGVDSVGSSAFSECFNLVSVKIPDGVTCVGSSAFFGCTGLRTLTIPDGVKSIDDFAFYDCRALRSLVIPSSLTHIGSFAFYGCSGLGSVTFPSSVTSIGNNAFDGCGALQVVFVEDEPQGCLKDCFGEQMWYQKIGTPISYEWKCSYANSKAEIIGVRPAFGDVVIPSVSEGYPVSSIRKEAFSGCGAITSVMIPSSVTSIGSGAFRSCGGLITVADDNSAYSSLDGILYDKSKSSLIQCPTGKTGPVEIPPSVTSIGFGAFRTCSGITSVTIPDGVTKIPSYMCFRCDELESVRIPDDVTSVGDYAFDGCGKLASVTIPEGVTYIGDGAFSDCVKLKAMTIPSSVTSIRQWAFGGCRGLETMTILNSKVAVGEYAFYECRPSTTIYMSSPGLPSGFSGLPIRNVIICDGVTSIDPSAFEDRFGLTSVTIPSSVTGIGERAFSGCSGLTSVTIPESVEDIGAGAFSGCSGLTSVTIPGSVRKIESEVFSFCTGLKTVTMPLSVTCIGESAFESCRELTSVVIPEGVVDIGSYAFFNCAGLKSVSIPSSVMRVDDYAFLQCEKLGIVHVCEGDAERVKGLYAWSSEVKFVEDLPPSIEGVPTVDGDEGAVIMGDVESGFVVKPSEEKTKVEIVIPLGLDAAKVTIEVSPKVVSVTPHGAKVRIINGADDITEFLDIPAADENGVIDLMRSAVRKEIAKEALNVEKGAVVDLDATSPVLTTPNTRKGLFYQFREGTTVEGMVDGDCTIGDGRPWSPKINVKGGNSAFYSIEIHKGR